MPYKRLYSAIALAALLLLGFIATSVISYFVAHESLSDTIAEDTLPLTSDNIYSEIERDLLRSVLISSLMAHDTFLRDWTTNGEKNPDRIKRYLREIQHKYDTTTAFYVSEKTHNYYHSSGILKQVSANDPTDAWYFRDRKMNKSYEINVDQDTADRSRVDIFVNYRVISDEGKFLGITGIGLSVHSVAHLIQTYQERYGREIYFVDRQGKVTLHGANFKGPDQLRERPGIRNIATQILADPSASLSYIGADGRRVYINSRLIPQFNWYLVVQQPVSRAEARILDTLLINVGVALVIAMLVGVIGWFSIRNYQVGLERMATTDPLTGGATRNVLEVIFDQVAKTARRRQTSVTLLAVDIDHFKQVNDRYGHGAGDTVLRRLAEVFHEHLRETDTVCRWGGDEFVILLANCALVDAHRIAQTIRAAAAERPFYHGQREISITLSIGVAERRGDEELVGLMARADAALYASKRSGRDRVTDA